MMAGLLPSPYLESHFLPPVNPLSIPSNRWML